MLEALEKHNGIVTVACRAVDIPRSTFYYWKENDEEFSKEVDDINEVAIDYVESKLFEKIEGVTLGSYDSEGQVKIYNQPPSDTAIIFYLKTKGKKRGYVERQEIEIPNETLKGFEIQPASRSKEDNKS